LENRHIYKGYIVAEQFGIYQLRFFFFEKQIGATIAGKNEKNLYHEQQLRQLGQLEQGREIAKWPVQDSKCCGNCI
jgi:hypothetical protein